MARKAIRDRFAGNGRPVSNKYVIDPQRRAALEEQDKLAARGLEPVQLDALFARVQTDIDAERGSASWLRARPTHVRWSIALGAAMLFVAGSVALAARPDLTRLPVAHALALAVYAGFVLLIDRELLQPMHEPRHPLWRTALALAAFGLPLAGVALIAGAPHAMPAIAGRTFCWPLGLGLAALFFATMRALDRGASAALRGQLLALGGAGLFANLVLVLCCPGNEPSHVLKAHAAVGVVFALLYLIARGVRRWVFNPRGTSGRAGR